MANPPGQDPFETKRTQDQLEHKFGITKLVYADPVAGGGWPYILLNGYPKISYDNVDARVVEQVIMRAADVDPFVNSSFGEWEETDQGLKRSSTRTWIGNSKLGCSQISAEAFRSRDFPWDPGLLLYGDNENRASFDEYAKVTVEYSPQQNNEDAKDDEAILEVHADASAEFLNTLSYEDADKSASLAESKAISDRNANPAIKVVPTTQWTVSWKYISDSFFRYRLLPEMRRVMGKVNSTNMSEVLFSLQPETCLFVGYALEQAYTWRDVKRTIQTTKQGIKVYRPFLNIHLKFIEKNVGMVSTPDEPNIAVVGGHNHGWKTKEGWIRLYRNRPKLDANGKPEEGFKAEPLYTPANLNFLFKPRLFVPDQNSNNTGDGNEKEPQ